MPPAREPTRRKKNNIKTSTETNNAGNQTSYFTERIEITDPFIGCAGATPPEQGQAAQQDRLAKPPWGCATE